MSKLKASDLQVAAVTTTGSATKAFSMAHQMGLAQFTLGSITIPTTITYLNNTETGRSGSNIITASNSFNGFTPFNNSGTYLYLIRPATSTSLNSNTGTDQWASALTYNITAGSTLAQTAYSRRHNWPATTSATWNYTCLGSASSFTVPCTGNYKIECWGAGGGAGMVDKVSFVAGPGKGGYTSGIISLSKSSIFYIYVGGKGEDMLLNGSRTYQDAQGGWNGGGLGAYDRSDDDGDGAGGGATDIRIVKAHASDDTQWNNFASLKSRIMVAGGGGGGGYRIHYGGCGGNTTGGQAGYGTSASALTYLSTINPGSQTSGYKFGQGQDGRNNPSQKNNTSAGGGGGYYGGQAHQNSPGLQGNSGYPAPGGSSYISGYTGCNAIKEDANSDDGGDAYHTGSPNHYSGLVFDSCNMINGNSSMPNYATNGNMTGNSGNGYCRINFVPN